MARHRDPVDRVVDAIVGVPIACASAVRQLLPFGPTEIERLIVRRLPVIVEGLRAGRRASREHTVVEPHESAHDTHEIEPFGVDLSATPCEDTIGEPSSLPIEGYDHLAARQIVDRLDSLSGDELGVIDAYERTHRRRQTVLYRIAQLT